VRRLYDVAEIRAAEHALMATLPDGALMQRAAAGLARTCAALLPAVYGARVVVLAGGGDNGGDALYAAARLADRGARVDALQVTSKVHPGGADAARRAGVRLHRAGSGDDERLLAAADLVVDGIVGIGAQGPLRPDAARLVELTDDAAGLVVAVDVPSGVDAATGRVDGAAVHADVTVTFGAAKPGLVVSPGAQHTGALEVVDIGLGPHLPAATAAELDADDVAALLPQPYGETSKYGRGVVGLVAGSDVYTGAAVLATGGAIAAGAGMVRFVGVRHPAELVRAHWPEAVVTVIEPGAADRLLAAGRVQAWVVGSGLGTDPAAAALVEAVLGTDVPVLVDADGITLLADRIDLLRRRTAPTLLTPHAGEFARLTGTHRAEVESDRLAHARRAAGDLGATVLLKGTTTVVAAADGQVRVNPTGTPWLATAGSGDVLAGACGALLAGGLAALEAGAVGAFLHGLAARLAAGPAGAQAPIRAADVIGRWPAAVRTVCGGADGSS
jgi:hydroxyethylthiazole kinase-like uncharacterized protein yjeF